jgi:Zn-dependent protease with chaperone function
LAALLLLSAVCTAQDGADHQRETSIYIRLTPLGDADFTLSSSAEEHLDQMRRNLFPCDWKAEEVDPGYVTGQCRNFLERDSTSVRGTLRIRPLLEALKAANMTELSVDVELPSGTAESASLSGRHWTTDDDRTAARWSLKRAGDLAGDLTISYDSPLRPGRLLVPLLIVLFVPPLIAWVMQTRKEASGALTSSQIGMNWIMLGAWLYWISAVRPDDIAAFVGAARIESFVANFLIGLTIFASPPLLAIASSLIALSGTNTGTGQLNRDLKYALLESASTLIPLGCLIMATSVSGSGKGVGIGVLTAYVSWRFLSWKSTHQMMGALRSVERGELYDRVRSLAEKAGVEVRGLFIARTPHAHDANAFAAYPGQVTVTESLLKLLNRREMDAVLSHELGHLRGAHPGIQFVSLWFLLLIGGPMLAKFLLKAGMPEWLLEYPIVMMAIIIAISLLSQRHEYSADARAVALTGDPEAKITALARLAKATRSPLHWNGILGSIVSHPSMRKRVLAIAGSAGVPGERALLLLEQPDLLATNAPDSHYGLPPELEDGDTVLNSTATTDRVKLGLWAIEATLVFGCITVGALTDRVAPIWVGVRGVPLYLAGCALVFWLHTKIDDLVTARFVRKMEATLRERLKPRPDAVFVGLRSGDRTNGQGVFEDWDIGFLELDAKLRFTGERTRFAVDRESVSDVDVIAGPFTWGRNYSTVVRGPSFGAFNLRADENDTPAGAKRLKLRLNQWRSSGSPAFEATEQEVVPELPAPAPNDAPFFARILFAVTKCAKLFLVSTFLMAVWVPGPGYTMFSVAMAPLLFLIASLPSLLRRAPRAEG